MNLFEKFFLTGALIASVGVSYAQEITDVALEIDDPEFLDLQSPDPDANTESKSWTPKDWLEMEVKFKVKDVKPRIPADKTVPELTVKWFVVVRDPTTKKKQFLRLEKEITHINIPIGEDIYTSVYFSPSAVRRLSGGRDRADKSLFWGIGGEFYYKGRLRGYFATEKAKTKDGKPFWYAPALSESKSVQLRDKSETPFKFFWWDRYAEIKPKDGSVAALPPAAGEAGK